MKSFRIALAQMQSALISVEDNVEKMTEWMEQAGAGHADLVVFPELASCGYNLDIVGQSLYGIAEKSSWVITELQKSAVQNRTAAVFGVPTIKAQRGILYNSAVVIDRDGRWVGTYDKCHAFGQERSFFRTGDQLPIFEICGQVKVGVMICYDAGFPEVARGLSIQGADLLLCPAAWIADERFLWESNLRSRAVDNLIPVVGVNRVGVEGGLTFFGGSRVVGSTGEILATAVDGEGLTFCDLDLDAFIQSRQTYKHMNDLRLDFYASMYRTAAGGTPSTP